MFFSFANKILVYVMITNISLHFKLVYFPFCFGILFILNVWQPNNWITWGRFTFSRKLLKVENFFLNKNFLYICHLIFLFLRFPRNNVNTFQCKNNHIRFIWMWSQLLYQVFFVEKTWLDFIILFISECKCFGVMV